MENNGFKALWQKYWPDSTFLFSICPFLPKHFSYDFQMHSDLLHYTVFLEGPVSAP